MLTLMNRLSPLITYYILGQRMWEVLVFLSPHSIELYMTNCTKESPSSVVFIFCILELKVAICSIFSAIEMQTALQLY